MEIQIKATPDIALIDGVQCRRWKGVTAQGVECEVFVHRIAVAESQDSSQFVRELREMLPPALPAVDLRHIL